MLKQRPRAADFAGPSSVQSVAVPMVIVALDYLLVSRAWIPSVGYLERGGAALIVNTAALLKMDARPGVAPRHRIRSILDLPSLLILGFLGYCLLILLPVDSGAGWLARWVGHKLQGHDVLCDLLVSVLVGPLIEEYIYRALVFRRLREAWGFGLAASASATLFWIVHWLDQGMVSSVLPLFAGLLLAWVYEETKSLVAPTLMHAAGNLIFFCLTWYPSFQS